MNAYLAMTKLQGAEPASELSRVLKNSAQKYGFYNNVIQEYSNAWRDHDLQVWYAHLFSRYYQIGSEVPAEQFIVESTTPLVTGNGRASVLETHVTLHPLYGIPYLSGAAIKGVAAHYCHRYLGEDDPHFRERGRYYTLLFGSTEQAGVVTYHDAWTTPETVKTALQMEVLTPHHQDYYQGGTQAPRDDDDPVPIPYIAVSARFQVMLTGTFGMSTSNQWLGIARDIVLQSLLQEGIGGKTNAGYGRMKELEK